MTGPTEAWVGSGEVNMRVVLLSGLFLLVGLVSQTMAQAPFELSLGYAIPSSGYLESYWDNGAAIDLRLPLRAGSREHLSLDLGGQLFAATSQNFGPNLRGARVFLSEHLAFPAIGGRLQVFASLGSQFLWTGQQEPLPLLEVPAQGSGSSDGVIFEGWGPAGSVGVGWTLHGSHGNQLQLQGSLTLASIEGTGQSYGVISLAYLMGR